MSELASLVAESRALSTYMLATVVRVSGSSYRRPGARMLVSGDRWIAGCVSGGCLEGDVLRRGAFRLRGGAPVVVTYDSRSDDDVAWGFGLGCNGVVSVLLENIDASTPLDPLRFADACFASESRGVLVTVYESADPRVPVGSRLAVADRTACTIAIDAVREAFLEAAMRCADGASSVTIDGVTALVETVLPPPHIFVVGSGHDAVPVALAAKAMGWRVTVVDAHARFATRERFSAVDAIVIGDLRDAVDRAHRAYAVLMTHDYDRDRAYLDSLLSSRARYIGVLGPERRTSRMLAEIAVSRSLDDAALARIHAPVGLDVGAETPREIALAIIGEIQATITGARGARLRERTGPIHPAPFDEIEATS